MTFLEQLLGGKKPATIAAIDQASTKAAEELESARNRLASLQVERPRLLLELSAADLRAHDDKMSDAGREVERITAAIEELKRRKADAQNAEAHAALSERIKASLGWHKRRTELLKSIQRHNLAAAKAIRALELDDERTIAVHREADRAGRAGELSEESEVSIRETQPYLEGQAVIPSIHGPDRLWPVNPHLWVNAEERFAGAEAEMAGKSFRRAKEVPERPAPKAARSEHVTAPRLNARREGDTVHLDITSSIDGRIVVFYSPTREFSAHSKIVHSVIGAGAGRPYSCVDLRAEAGFYLAIAQVSEYGTEHRSEIVEVPAYKAAAAEVSA